MVTNNYQRFNPYPLLLFLLLFLFAAFFLASCPGIDGNDEYPEGDGDNDFVANGWEMTIIDSNESDNFSHSLAVDVFNHVHISYNKYVSENSTYPSSNLFYATNRSGSWVTEIVDSDGDNGACNSIATDKNGVVYISYLNMIEYGSDANEVKLAKKIDGKWEFEVVMNDDMLGSKIAINSFSSPVILLFHGRGPATIIDILTYSAGKWEAEEIGAGDHACLLLDSDDNVHFSQGGGSLGYLTNESGEWEYSKVAEGREGVESYLINPSMAINSKNDLFIAYFSYFESIQFNFIEANLNLASMENGQWKNSILIEDGWDSGYVGPGSPTLAMDSDDALHMVYYRKGRIYYATNKEGEWESRKVASGKYCSLVLDNDDYAHIIYSYSTNDDRRELRYITNR